MRHLRDRERLIYGPYAFKSGRLTYRTQDAEHAAAAQQARDSKHEFNVTALDPEQRDFRGKVESVNLIVGEKPTRWEIVIKTTA